MLKTYKPYIFCLLLLSVKCVTSQYYISPSYGINFTLQHTILATDNGKYFNTYIRPIENFGLYIGRIMNNWEAEIGIERTRYSLAGGIFIPHPEICKTCGSSSGGATEFQVWHIPIRTSYQFRYRKWSYGPLVGASILFHRGGGIGVNSTIAPDYTFIRYKSDVFPGIKPNAHIGTNIGFAINAHHEFHFQALYNYGFSNMINQYYKLTIKHDGGTYDIFDYKTSFKGDYIGLRLTYRYIFNPIWLKHHTAKYK